MSAKSASAKISQPYAEAFLEIANNNTCIENTNQDAQTIIDLILKTESLNNFLKNPLVNTQSKKEVINKVFLENVSNLTLKFLLVLVDRERIRYVSTIMEKYLELANKVTSIEIAKIYSAVRLSYYQKMVLREKLQYMTSAKHVKLLIEITPEILGGFKIQIGSQVIDATLTSQLTQLYSYLGGK
uniref:ATP synthase CF1 delta subunit n=1 Tax=Gronococcus sybilensis TaxID=3028029 RepID=A0A9Y1I2K8_9RHOD|nr:ATP synthase CF1 delta subunit [Gronococcus sybilensis]